MIIQRYKDGLNDFFLIDKRVRKRKKPINGSWRMHETYIKLNGKWVYVYKAVDSEGNTVDFLLRARRDTAAAKAFKETRYLKVNIDKIGSHKVALDSLNKEAIEEEKIEIREIK